MAVLVIAACLAASPGGADDGLVASGTGSVSVPPGFVVESLGPNLGFTSPTCMAFLPDGRLLVGEKRGRLYLVENGIKQQTPIWSEEKEVLNPYDFGLMSVAVDPQYFQNHFIYLLYTVDPDSNGIDIEDHGFGRLVRYEMGSRDTNTLDPGTRTVLMGADWAHGPVATAGSHTVGSLRFGEDGTLLVSIGEGGDAGTVDPGKYHPQSFGPGRTPIDEDIGAFRSQDLFSLCGKILRIDPATGHGLPSNPYFDGDPTSARSRVWEYGLRNPFRFAVRPNTGGSDPEEGSPGTLYIGDVGWLTWEELDVAATAGANFGWPCYEGPGENPGYQMAKPASHSCATLGGSDNRGELKFPTVSWTHQDRSLGNPPGFIGNCSMGGVFYTGDRYPARYHGRYFFADFGANWLKAATFDSLDHLTALETFGDFMQSPVDFAVNPVTGDICYVSIEVGEVRRIRYQGPANLPPVVVASAVPDSGRAPLIMQFSSAGSRDPEGQPLTWLWDFDDGGSSIDPAPAHEFKAGGSYDVVLTVTDSLGAAGRGTVHVRLSGPRAFPAAPVLDSFNQADGPLGPAWSDNIAAMVVRDSALTQNGPPSPSGVWSGAAFGPDQEAFVTLRTIAPACKRYSLLLKIQSKTFTSGGIEVRYDATLSTIEVSTYQPGPGWKNRGTFPAAFQNGDRFGARAYSDGVLQVFRNADKIGEVSLRNWALVANGGSIGIDLAGATGSQLEDFGGGTIFSGVNTEPTAVIDSPAALTFAAEGDTVHLRSASFDAQDTALAVQWTVDLHHNNHIHPAWFSSNRPQDSFVMINHDDGTGVFFQVNLRVTDSGGLEDAVSAPVYPDINLTCSPLTVTPDPLLAGVPASCRFTIQNTGGARSPRFRWLLSLDGRAAMQGDTLLFARSSMTLTANLPAPIATGVHTLRLVADTLGQVYETLELDNAAMLQTVAIPGSGNDHRAPSFVGLPAAEPYAVFSWIRWRTDEPTIGVIYYGRTLALGDSVTAPNAPDTTQAMQLQGLTPGAAYYWRLAAIDLAGNRTLAAVDSFETRLGPADAGGPGIPRVLELSQARPNPTHGAIAFDLALPRPAAIAFVVYDLLGREMWRAPQRQLAAGRWPLMWPGTSAAGRALPPGLYLARVRAGDVTLTRRIAILR